jgi:hypothetical protein
MKKMAQDKGSVEELEEGTPDSVMAQTGTEKKKKI